MSPESRDTVTFVLGTLTTLVILAGLATRYVLVPYLRDHLIQPIQETHKQVTENHHANREQPTVLDRIADVQTDINTLTRVLDGHMRTSDQWLDLFTNRLDRHQARLLALEAKKRRTDT